MSTRNRYRRQAPPAINSPVQTQAPPAWTSFCFGFLTFSTLAFIGLFVLQNYPLLKEMSHDLGVSQLNLWQNIDNSEAFFPFEDDHIHVKKSEIETQLAEILNSSPKEDPQGEKSGNYYVVYGPTGVEKTEVVHHAVMGRKGVVSMRVYEAHSVADIVTRISLNILSQSDLNKLRKSGAKIDLDALVEAVMKCKMRPIFIFDVECGGATEKNVLSTVRSLCKTLAPYCHCFIVLSEANAILEFGKDPREKYIYVDEMSTEEATKLLGNLNVKLREEEMKFVFDHVGTNPVILHNLAQHWRANKPLKSFVDDQLATAEAWLVAFPLQIILKALKEHPDGVPTAYFKKQEEEGTDLSSPQQVGIAMKKSNCIVYRIEQGRYTLQSTDMRTALKTYEPIINSNTQTNSIFK